MQLKLYQAFQILRKRGITDLKVGLPELEVVDGPGDAWAVYSLEDFHFSVDADGNVVGGREAFDQKLKLLPTRGRR